MKYKGTASKKSPINLRQEDKGEFFTQEGSTQHSARAKRPATALSAAMPAGLYSTQHLESTQHYSKL